MTTLTRRDDGIFVLNLGEGDIRFNATTVSEIGAALDEVESAVAATGPPAALVTMSDSKIWSNGLDLDWMSTIDDAFAFITTVHHLLARLMKLPIPTIAAIDGHAFAGGAMMSLAHDIRVMRTDRGYFCLPEVDLGMSFGKPFAAIVAAKVPTGAITRLAVLGERMTGPAALAAGVIDEVAEEGEVVTAAIAQASRLTGKAKPNLAVIRREYYRAAIDALAASGSE